MGSAMFKTAIDANEIQSTVPVMGLESMLFRSQTWDVYRSFSQPHLAFKAFFGRRTARQPAAMKPCSLSPASGLTVGIYIKNAQKILINFKSNKSLLKYTDGQKEWNSSPFIV